MAYYYPRDSSQIGRTITSTSRSQWRDQSLGRRMMNQNSHLPLSAPVYQPSQWFFLIPLVACGLTLENDWPLKIHLLIFQKLCVVEAANLTRLQIAYKNNWKRLSSLKPENKTSPPYFKLQLTYHFDQCPGAINYPIPSNLPLFMKIGEFGSAVKVILLGEMLASLIVVLE